MGVAAPDKSWRGRGWPAGAGGSHVGAWAHMTGRAMDPLPSAAVAAAAEAEADEEADPPATGKARGGMESPAPLCRGPPVCATPRLTWLGGGGHPGVSIFPLLPGTLLSSSRLARGRVELHLDLL